MHKTNGALTAAQNCVIKLLAHSLFQTEFTPDSETDWEKVLTEAEQQAVFPLVFHAAESFLPLELSKKKKTLYFKHLYNNLGCIHAHGESHCCLTNAGIPYVVLKGCVSASYYPEPELRTMGDVDLYVEKSDMTRVRSAMEAEGFHVSGLNHPHHWTFSRTGRIVEIHWVPSGIPAADDGAILACFNDILKRSQPTHDYEETMIFPSAYHHGLVLLLHIVNHLTAGGIGLRHLLDWLVFQNSMSEKDFLEIFEPTLKRIGLWQFARAVTAVGVRFFSCQYRDFCKDLDPKLAEELFLDILNGGNFGRKNSNRLNQSKILRDNQTRQISNGGYFLNAFGFLNQRARTAFPPAQKTPILLPVGWIKVLSNHSRAVRRGVQPKIRVNDLLDGAKKRQHIYEQLHLFEK